MYVYMYVYVCMWVFYSSNRSSNRHNRIVQSFVESSTDSSNRSSNRLPNRPIVTTRKHPIHNQATLYCMSVSWDLQGTTFICVITFGVMAIPRWSTRFGRCIYVCISVYVWVFYLWWRWWRWWWRWWWWRHRFHVSPCVYMNLESYMCGASPPLRQLLRLHINAEFAFAILMSTLAPTV